MRIRVGEDLTGYAPKSERFWAVDDETWCGCPECHYPVGRGATEQAAIEDLLEQVADIEACG